MPEQKLIDELIRDITKVGFMSKSEVRERINSLLQNERREATENNEELLDALLGMYEQYCQNGHEFMSAGERASSVLEEYGFGFDGAGRIKVYPNLPNSLEEKK